MFNNLCKYLQKMKFQRYLKNPKIFNSGLRYLKFKYKNTYTINDKN